MSHRQLPVAAVVAMVVLAVGPSAWAGVPDANLVENGAFARHTADGFTLTGGATFGPVGDPRRDAAGYGVALDARQSSGDVSCVVARLDPAAGRWFRFSVRGLPEADFAAADLRLTVAFFGQGGRVSYDAKAKPILDQVTQARHDLSANGVGRRGGAEAWRTYAVEFMLPFPQVDQVRLGVGFTGGTATAGRTRFLVDEMSLVRIPTPPTAGPATRPTAVAVDGPLLPLGGRWYYAARPGETAPPRRFDAANVDRLLYHDAVYSAPFAGNTTAWLRAGDVDAAGRVVGQDRFVADNVVLEFTGDTLVVRSHDLPNHPTGRFPEQGFGNPNRITERADVWYLPVNPRVNPAHRSTDPANANHALHMGPIGVAVNGVVFYNPFDAGSQDATDMMDRCCGHPSPDGQYHYHKYPICVNSPWDDQGTGHSGLIGFAFDGFPVYGPYESPGVMAKDLTGDRALNDFNLHYDADRGWHYHVTPGRFPYLIGGFWGVEDGRDVRVPRGGGRPGRRPPPPPPGDGPDD